LLIKAQVARAPRTVPVITPLPLIEWNDQGDWNQYSRI